MVITKSMSEGLIKLIYNATYRTCRNISLFIGNVTVILMNAAPQPHTNSLPSSIRGDVLGVLLGAWVVVRGVEDEPWRSGIVTADFSAGCFGRTTPRDGGRPLQSCPTTFKPCKSHSLKKIPLSTYIKL